ncbi:hypothetical protein XENOCAPTIV_027962, partial [Xenoophorus captivus]
RGRGQSIFWVVFMTLCTAFLSSAEETVYHTTRQYVSTLSTEERWKVSSSFVSMLFFLRTCRKWSCQAFFTRILMVQELSEEMRVSRNLKVVAVSTCSPSMRSGCGPV